MKIEDTNKIKGLALILMYWHHFFDINNFLTLPDIEWKGIFSNTLTVTIGYSGKICVAMFLFCSGYGLYHVYFSRDKVSFGDFIDRLMKILIPYWVINLLIAIPYLVYMKHFNPGYIGWNLFALLHNDDILYVSFSWFIKLYLGILLFLPLLRLLEKRISRNMILDIVLYILFPAIVAFYFKGYIREEQYYGIGSFVISSLLMVVSFYPVFHMGVLFKKYAIDQWIMKKSESFGNKIIRSLLSLLGFILILFLFALSNRWDARFAETIYAPMILMFLMLFFDNCKCVAFRILGFLGRYSLQYWLLSGMFFLNTSELQWIAYLPGYSVLIVGWTLLLLTPAAILCNRISKGILTFLSLRQYT